jgi:hypothetical protein
MSVDQLANGLVGRDRGSDAARSQSMTAAASADGTMSMTMATTPCMAAGNRSRANSSTASARA